MDSSEASKEWMEQEKSSTSESRKTSLTLPMDWSSTTAKTSPSPERGPGFLVQGRDSGASTSAAFATFDPNTSLSKTCPDFSVPEGTSPEDAYAAGLIDGEGSLTITQRKRYYTARIEIGMTERALPVLHSMQTSYGGKVSQLRDATEKWEAAWRWRVFGKEAVALARRVYPLLRLKAEHAELILRLAQVPSPSEEAAQLKVEINRLNQKGTRPVQPAELVWLKPQQTITGEWESYSETWPPSGTMRSGKASRLPPLVRRTSAGGSSLLPAITASEGGANKSPGEDSKVRPTLTTMARHNLWATPQAADSWVPAHTTENTLKRGNPDAKNRSRPGTLTKQVVEPKYWPTPTAGEGTGAGHAGKGGLNLRTAVETFPTPTVEDAKNNNGPSQSSRNTPPLNAVIGGRLNPEFVEWLQGFPKGWTEVE